MNDSGSGRSPWRWRPPADRAQTRGRASSARSGGPASSSSGRSIWPIVCAAPRARRVLRRVSWFGLWRVVADPVRIAILVGFALAPPIFVFTAFRLRRPARAAALARVEAATGALHRPATAFADRLAVGSRDPAAEALWTAHRDAPARRPRPAQGRASRRPASPGATHARSASSRCSSSSSPSSSPGRSGSSGSAKPSAAANRSRDDCPHRCLGDAAGLYRPGADLPDRRGGEAARAPRIRCRPAASSRCAPAAPTISTWSASTDDNETPAETVDGEAPTARRTDSAAPLERQVTLADPGRGGHPQGRARR